MDLSTLLVSLHLGALHPVEHALTLLLAFGPFVLLGVVIVVRRRQDASYDAAGREAEPDSGTRGGPEVEAQRDR